MKKIYLARQSNTDLYKIGITKKNPIERLKELQTGNAAEFELVHQFETKHGYKMETALHAHYASKKIKGEWFLLENKEIDSFIQECQNKEDIMSILRNSNPYWNS